MASNTQDEILKRFEEAAWNRASGGSHEIAAGTSGTAQQQTTSSETSAIADTRSERAGVPAESADLRTKMDRADAAATGLNREADGEAGLRSETAIARGMAGETLAGPGSSTVGATEPAGQNVQGGVRTEDQSGGGASTAETVLKDVFESGLGLVPLIGGLMGLFGGGSDNQPSLLKYQMPSSISFMSADSGDQLIASDYNESGLPREYGAAYTDAAPAGGGGVGAPSPSAAGFNGGATGSDATGTSAATASGSGAAAAPQITVNVQAMDAQSFLDRSSDIAQAVRSAMLSMNSINDVVSDL